MSEMRSTTLYLNVQLKCARVESVPIQLSCADANVQPMECLTQLATRDSVAPIVVNL